MSRAHGGWLDLLFPLHAYCDVITKYHERCGYFLQGKIVIDQDDHKKDRIFHCYGFTLSDLQTVHSGHDGGGMGLFCFSGQPCPDNASGNDVQDNQW